MCILFVYNASDVPDSDYHLIIACNRDEAYDRPTGDLAPWEEDLDVIGGRDLQAGGTWLAVSPLRAKVGVLLNLPTENNPNAKTRGKLAVDFVKSDVPAREYIESMRGYAAECNHFNFVALDFGLNPELVTYNNLTDDLRSWPERQFGISNSLPESPLKKVEAGKRLMQGICDTYKKIHEKNQLVEKLIELMKSRERHLPDPRLLNREEASAIYVCVPERRYGTRTHTIILITKTGHIDVIEMTMQEPVDAKNPRWKKTEMQFDTPLHKLVDNPPCNETQFCRLQNQNNL